jgi:hypothetical protein
MSSEREGGMVGGSDNIVRSGVPGCSRGRTFEQHVNKPFGVRAVQATKDLR